MGKQGGNKIKALLILLTYFSPRQINCLKKSTRHCSAGNDALTNSRWDTRSHTPRGHTQNTNTQPPSGWGCSNLTQDSNREGSSIRTGTG